MPDLYGQLTPQGVLNGSLQTIMYADNYNDLTNKPSINSVELQGNKTAADLGLLTAGDIPVDSVNGKQGVVILDGDDIEYEAGTSVNSKITDLEAEIGSGPVISVNGQQGVVELDGTDINYSLTKTLNQKIDEVAASIPVVSYPVTSVNTKTGDVVLDGDDIDYAEGVTVNDQIGTNVANIGSLSQLTTTDKSSIVGAINEIASYTPVYGNTASGAIATFDTSLALPLQDCTIAINAVQESGTPSPDNVRPITGFSSVNVSVSGVNIWDEQWEVGSYNSAASTVVKVVDNTHIRSKNPIRVLPNHTYYMNSAENSVHLIVADTNGNVLYRTATLNNGTFTTPADGVFVYFNMARAYGVTYNNDVSINYLSTDTDYHAYNGTTVTIPLGQTVYGGSLDVTTGVLTITHYYWTDDGTKNWKKNPDGSFYVLLGTPSAVHEATGACNYAPYVISFDGLNVFARSNGLISLGKDWGNIYADVTALKSAFAITPLQVVYPLATPITVQLTPTQISAIVGTNNVFTDTNGNTSVVFACSLKDYIEGQ